LRFRRKSKRAINASKITINKREAKDDAREARETKIEARKIETNIKANVKTNAKITTIATTIITIIINKKQLLRFRKQFACTHVSLVFEITLILLSYLLLLINSRKCANNTLYNQKLIKLLN